MSVALCLALIVAWAVTTLSAAYASTTCAYEPATNAVTVTFDDDNDTATLKRNGSAIELDSVACGAATVANTDTINAGGNQLDDELEIDLSGGAFAPGSTAESDGSSEIEWGFSELDNLDITVLGTDQKDVIRVGRAGINLNGTEAQPDVDVVTKGADIHSIDLDLGAGNDIGSGTGIGAAVGHPAVVVLNFHYGPGDDRWTGGSEDDIFFAAQSDDGDDLIDGRGGLDIADYIRTVDLEISEDGVANDGEAGEKDNVKSIDFVHTGTGNDTVSMRTGNDRIIDNGGDNTFFGGVGNDTIQAREGRDDFHGGPGNDLVQYASESSIRVTIDGRANDGLVGGGGASIEHDNVHHDVEGVLGGIDDDVLIGDGNPNRLIGGPGDDRLFGRGGDDLLVDSGDEYNGGTIAEGNDVFSGGPGVDTVDFRSHIAQVLHISIDGVRNDTSDASGTDFDYTDNVRLDVENVLGSTGNDRIVGDEDPNDLRGGSGMDHVRGGRGPDSLFGGPNDDTLEGGPGNDALDGGGGTDTCHQGSGTGPSVGCEA